MCNGAKRSRSRCMFSVKNLRIWSICIRLALWGAGPLLTCHCWWDECRQDHSNGLGWRDDPWGRTRDSSNIPWGNQNCYLTFSEKNKLNTLRKPVGVMTEGCTWLLQKPSHLLTVTSPSHVRCSLPSSSYSSVKICLNKSMNVNWNANKNLWWDATEMATFRNSHRPSAVHVPQYKRRRESPTWWTSTTWFLRNFPKWTSDVSMPYTLYLYPFRFCLSHCFATHLWLLHDFHIFMIFFPLSFQT